MRRMQHEELPERTTPTKPTCPLCTEIVQHSVDMKVIPILHVIECRCCARVLQIPADFLPQLLTKDAGDRRSISRLLSSQPGRFGDPLRLDGPKYDELLLEAEGPPQTSDRKPLEDLYPSSFMTIVSKRLARRADR